MAAASAGQSSPSAVAFQVISPPTSNVLTPSASPPPSLRQAPFALNREKQVKNLRSEASSLTEPYVSSEVKNSGKFVGLKCCPAYFNSVACPVLLTLGASFNQELDGLLVSAATEHQVDTVDTTGLTTTHLLKFTISSNTLPPSHLAKVSVHMHKTRRSVDIHSEAFLPNQHSAAVWFSEVFLMPRLHKQSKHCSFSSATVAQMHGAILRAFSSSPAAPATASSRPRPTRPRSSQGAVDKPTCFQCGKVRTDMAPCAGCRQYFHKKCLEEHLCGKELMPSEEKSPQLSPISRKRPAALDTTGFRSLSYRDVRQHLDIDSDNSEDERQPHSRLPSLLPSSSEPAPPTTGQQLLSSSLSSRNQALPAPSLVPANSSPTPFSSFSSLPAPAPGMKKKRGPRIGVTAKELDVEMLQRELTMAKTKIVSLENAAEELKVSKSLLAQRVQLFEQRESDRNFSQYFPPTAPPSAPCSTSSGLAVCCPSSSLHLKELHSLQSQVFELQSQVTLIATSLSQNQSKVPNISLGDDTIENSTGQDSTPAVSANDIQKYCPNPIPGSVSDANDGNIVSSGSNQSSIAAASAEHDQISWFNLIPGTDMRFPPPVSGAPITSTRPRLPEAEVGAVEVLPLDLQTPLQPTLAAPPQRSPRPIPRGEPSLDEQGLSPDDIQCIEEQISQNPQYLEEQPASTLPVARRRRPKRRNRQKRPRKLRPSRPPKTGLLIDLN